MNDVGWALAELHESGALPDQIIEATAHAFGLTSAEVHCKSRTQSYVLPRQIAIYLVRELCGLSWPEVGRALCRDHTSCMTAHARAVARIHSDARVAGIVARLRDQLGVKRIAAE